MFSKGFPIQIPTGNYMFKISNKHNRARCEICSKLTIKTRHWRRSGVLIVNSEPISHLVLVLLLLVLNRQMPTGVSFQQQCTMQKKIVVAACLSFRLHMLKNPLQSIYLEKKRPR